MNPTRRTTSLAALLAIAAGAVAKADNTPDNSWYLWDYPPVGHPLLDDPRVKVMAIVLKDSVDDSKPPGYPNYITNTIPNLVKRMADHLEYQGFYRGGPRDRGDGYGGVATLLNWGVFDDYRLTTNEADAVPGSGCRLYTLYDAAGRSTGPGTLYAHTSAFMSALKAELDLRGLTYPEIFVQDFENRADVEFSFRCASVYPFDLVGNWDASVASSRYTSEVLVTLDGNKTLADLVAAQPSLPRNSNDYFFSGLMNRAWSKQVYIPIEQRVFDESLYQTFGVFVNTLFPNAVYGSYGLLTAHDPAHPYRDQFQSWLSWYEQNPAVRLRATLWAPVCYGPRIEGGASYEPSVTEAPELGSTIPEIWRNYAIGQLQAAMGGAHPVDLLPHMETPGTVSANIWGQYTPTVEDVAYVLAHHAALGQHQWLIFNPLMNAQQADDTRAALAMFDLMTCYPNCDGSTAAPAVNVADFACFINRFASGDTWANCDASTTPPALNVLDFFCFINAFAAGCP